MKRPGLAGVVLAFLFCPLSVNAAAAPVSEATAECLDCHESIHPGIVHDWKNSRHFRMTPGRALGVKPAARRVSGKTIPAHLQKVAVGCAECHMISPQTHSDTFEHNGYDIHVVVTPADCRTCHEQEADQYAANLMARAYGNLADNALYHQLQRSIIGRERRRNGKISFAAADDETRAEACYYCHGTRLTVSGTRTRETEIAGELEFPVIKGWPNQGVGRVNPDGSLGSCAACHSRHVFSIEMARKPYACKKCHVGPDVPAFKVYAASRHGTIFSAMHKSWNFDAVPWTIGRDFAAPTCAVCHISLLVNEDGEEVSPRTHRMNDRLPWRIYGLIYAHPHPREADTTMIRNKDGLPLPTDLDGGFASGYLIDAKEQAARRKKMQRACLNCHADSWVRGYWRRLQHTIQRTNARTRMTTGIMQEIWRLGLARGPADGGNPFDEAVEKKWVGSWLFRANTIRFASAMAGGGDYGVFAGGRFQQAVDLQELSDWLQLHRKSKGSGPGKGASK